MSELLAAFYRSGKKGIVLTGVDPGKCNALAFRLFELQGTQPNTVLGLRNIVINRYGEEHDWACSKLARGLLDLMRVIGNGNINRYALVVMIEEPKFFPDEKKDRAQAAAQINNMGRMNRHIGYLAGSIHSQVELAWMLTCTQNQWKAGLASLIPGMHGNIPPVDYMPRNKKEQKAILQGNMFKGGYADGKLPGYRTLIREHLANKDPYDCRIVGSKSAGDPGDLIFKVAANLTADECSAWGIMMYLQNQVGL